MDNLPVGRVGESTAVPSGPRQDIKEMARLYDAITQTNLSKKEEPALSQRAKVSLEKLEKAIQFWKPIYFGITVEGRHLNGIEAYELGDPEKTPGSECDKSPYIAMCNLMALEAVKMMGEQMPTAHSGVLLAYASDREKEIAQFWKDTFAPTEFQSDWAWTACLGVLSGSEIATEELLDRYRDQLP